MPTATKKKTRPGGRPLGSLERFALLNGRPGVTEEALDAEALGRAIDIPAGSEVTSAHTRGRETVRLYRSNGEIGWQPREVLRQEVGICLMAGDLPYCADCVRVGVSEADAMDCDGHPNECPGKQPRAVMYCPVPNCNGGRPKQFIDMPTVVSGARQDDPNEIKFSVTVTPQARLEAALREHMEYTHPREARAIFGQLGRDRIDATSGPAPISIEQAMGMMGKIG